MPKGLCAFLHASQVHSCRLTPPVSACKYAHMDEVQEATRRFIRELLRATGWTASRLAIEAGVSHTTLTRFLNSEDATHTLSNRTLAKIRAAVAKEIPQDQIDGLWLVSQKVPPPQPRKAART